MIFIKLNLWVMGEGPVPSANQGEVHQGGKIVFSFHAYPAKEDFGALHSVVIFGIRE